MKDHTVIAIDLGGTKVSGAIFDRQSMLSSREVLMLENQTGKDVGALVLELIRKLREQANRRGLTVSGVGVAVPGIYHADSRTVWAPNIPGWEDYPLYEEIASGVKGADITVKIDSDRACCIMGEAWKGAAQDCRYAIFLAVGTGIGAGIMVDGMVLRGAHDIAGAVGWMALDRPWTGDYMSCGCFEYHASGNGMAERAKNSLKEKESAFIDTGSNDPEKIVAGEIFKAYSTGDPHAVAIINNCIEFWGMACANLVSIFNPEKIIFGGGVFGPAVQFLGNIYEEARKWAQPVSIQKVTFTAAGLGQDAGLYGAACLALDHNPTL